jgi:hypothetical protein
MASPFLSIGLSDWPISSSHSVFDTQSLPNRGCPWLGVAKLRREVGPFCVSSNGRHASVAAVSMIREERRP